MENNLFYFAAQIDRLNRFSPLTLVVTGGIAVILIVLSVAMTKIKKKKCTAVTKGMCTDTVPPGSRRDPVIWYSYEVDGKKYTVCANAHRYRSDYQVIRDLIFKPVVVRYNPKRPKSSYPDIEATLRGLETE